MKIIPAELATGFMEMQLSDLEMIKFFAAHTKDEQLMMIIDSAINSTKRRLETFNKTPFSTDDFSIIDFKQEEIA